MTNQPPESFLGLSALRRTEGWAPAIEELRARWEANADEARANAEAVGARNHGRRGRMVLEVVLSRQRRYDTRIRGMLTTWLSRIEDLHQKATMAWVADHPESFRDLASRQGETSTVINVASALLRYGRDHDIADEDSASQAWARGTAGLELAWRLDPYVGAVSGIGPALFAYTRMLCGQDTIKPDARILRQLSALGLTPPRPALLQPSSPRVRPPMNSGSAFSSSTSCSGTQLRDARHPLSGRSGLATYLGALSDLTRSSSHGAVQT
ncbi:hypothetical protein [Actinomycetospora straminea]|uniref:Uncharacterized protein n=1 Tax=Actinomycetospora straminea TaxID=663607 RepID=A0ABP9EIF6_9PSEU|nr:hypothetical protein [Actinomycetospora straminea]MDD7933720.1 hypothetical protein [Actinomycetospora straminea]